MEKKYRKEIHKATKYIQSRMGISLPESSVAIFLGSGLGEFIRNVEILGRIPYQKILGFRKPSVPGHAGELILARQNRTVFWIASGRIHYYEGYGMETVTFPVHVLAKLGVHVLILSNAAGSVSGDLHPGDVVILEDHINGMGANPSRHRFLLEKPFTDLMETYNKKLISDFMAIGQKYSVPIKKGIYYAVSGPSFETPAEIRMMAKLGADMVGMSTVPEAVAGKYHGMKIFAFSVISNYGSGISGNGVDHGSVLETVKESMNALNPVLLEFIGNMKSLDEDNEYAGNSVLPE